jgi:hypothetical protein
MDQVIEIINTHATAWLLFGIGILGSLVVLASLYVALTPSKDDDTWLSNLYKKPIIGHLLTYLAAFSFIEKKEKKVSLSNK